MQATSRLVSTLGELATRMWNGENDGSSWEIITLIEHKIKGHTTPLIAYGHPPFAIDTRPDILPKARHRFIDRVVQRLPDQVKQAGGRGRTDVHSGTMTDRSNSLQHLNVSG